MEITEGLVVHVRIKQKRIKMEVLMETATSQIKMACIFVMWGKDAEIVMEGIQEISHNIVKTILIVAFLEILTVKELLTLTIE